MRGWKLFQEHRVLEEYGNSDDDSGSFDTVRTTIESGIYLSGKPITHIRLEDGQQAREGEAKLASCIYTFTKSVRGNGGYDDCDDFSVTYFYGIEDICGNKLSCGLSLAKGDGRIIYFVDETIGFNAKEYDGGLVESFRRNNLSSPTRTRVMTSVEVEDVCGAFLRELEDFDRTRYSWRHIADDISRFFGAGGAQRKYNSEKHEKSVMKEKIMKSIPRIRSKSLDVAI
ncbi:MAG: hypothetical protein V1813_00770 [Candidatus Aenigmatarchaeota archaeon]